MAEPLILIVDDEPSIRETVGFILEMEGFQVATAEDGEQGLDAVRRLRPPVVLLDAMMPLSATATTSATRSRATRSSPACT